MPPLKAARAQEEQADPSADWVSNIYSDRDKEASKNGIIDATPLTATSAGDNSGDNPSRTAAAAEAKAELIPVVAAPSPSPTKVDSGRHDHTTAIQISKATGDTAVVAEAGVDVPLEFVPVAAAPAPSQSKALLRGQSTKGQMIMGNSDLGHDVEELAKSVDHDGDVSRLLRPARRIPPSKGDTEAVPRDTLAALINERIERSRECLMIPFIVAYFVVFSLCLLMHERTKDLSQVEREFRGMLEGTTFEGVTGQAGKAFINPVPVSGHKTLDDIDVIQDIYTYMQDALLPLFIQNGAKPLDRSRVLSYNQLIGGVTFAQTRKQKRPCSEGLPNKTPGAYWLSSSNPLLENFDCYPIDSGATDCYGPGPPWLEGFCPNSKAKAANSSRRLQEEGEGPLFYRWLGTATSAVVDAFHSVNEQFTSGSLVGGGVGRGKNGRRLSPSAHAAKSRMGKKAKKAMQEDGGELFSLTFNTHEGLEVAWHKLAELKANNWMDWQTSWVGVRVFVLNPDLAVFCSAAVNIFFAPSGELVPYLVANSFLMDPFQDKTVYLLDGCFFMLWLHLGFCCVVSLIKAIRAKRCKAYFFAPRALLEWFTFVGGAGVLAFCYQYVINLNALKDKIASLVLATPDGENSSPDVSMRYLEQRVETVQSMLSFDSYAEFFRVYISWYTMFIMLRFFRAFEAQPKLKVVTLTITASLYDLIHFGVVFCLVLIAFTISAMVLFGHRLVEYASWDQAFMQATQIVIGNFDFQELAEENLATTTIWFVAFVSLLTMIMLNMILAIMMDVYGDAKNASAESDSLFEQYRDIKNDIFNKKLVPKSEVLKVISDLPDEEFSDVTKERLMKACPNMPPDQATDLIEKVAKEEMNEDETHMSLSDVTHLISLIKNQSKIIEHQIFEIRSEQEKGKDFEEEQRRIADELGFRKEPGKPAIFWLHETAEKRIRSLEARLDGLEEFLNQAMSYVNFRGTELKNRLKAIEEFLRGRRGANELGNIADVIF